MKTENITILEIANRTNEFILKNPDIFPKSWEVIAIIKTHSYNQFIDGKWETFEKDYVKLIHSDKIESSKVYCTSDLFLPIEWGKHIG